jgi:hypothetical protein
MSTRQKYADSPSLQCRVDRTFHNRVVAHAKRRGLTVSDWLREQARFGLEADDEAVATGDKQERGKKP